LQNLVERPGGGQAALELLLEYLECGAAARARTVRPVRRIGRHRAGDAGRTIGRTDLGGHLLAQHPGQRLPVRRAVGPDTRHESSVRHRATARA
jgi:hypothetical protein